MTSEQVCVRRLIRNQKSGHAKILDFGLVDRDRDDGRRRRYKNWNSGATPDESWFDNGDCGVQSPEQVQAKELDARTDLFSFGAVLYEMPTATLPFRGETSGVIFESILNRAPVPPVRLNPDIPAGLEHVINKALEKDRDVRCQSAAEFEAR